VKWCPLIATKIDFRRLREAAHSPEIRRGRDSSVYRLWKLSLSNLLENVHLETDILAERSGVGADITDLDIVELLDCWDDRLI
jgi:hypothetical protein